MRRCNWFLALAAAFFVGDAMTALMRYNGSRGNDGADVILALTILCTLFGVLQLTYPKD